MIYYKKRIEHYKINMLLKKNLDIQLGKAERQEIFTMLPHCFFCTSERDIVQ